MIDLVLASASPRRADLLRGAGLRIETRPTRCDETPHAREPAVAYALRIAEAKLDAAPLSPQTPTLVADTVVWHEHTAEPLGKPRDRDAARLMLRSLLGHSHFVTTAWALRRGDAVHIEHETTRVWMRSLPEAVLERYLATDEWSDKAGGYGIQSNAAGWVQRIEGSYTNVMGLPLCQVLEALAQPHGGPRS